MSSKQRRPLDNPPSPLLEEEVEDMEEEEQVEEEEEDMEEVEEEEEEVEEEVEEEEEEEVEVEEEIEEEEVSPPKQIKKKPQQPQSSSETIDSANLKSPRASDFTVKPVKRPAENSAENGKQPKKAKPEVEVEVEEEVEEKKPAVIRMWTEKDELAFLKGIHDFQSNTGKDASINLSEFHHFLVNSLQFDFTKTQIINKFKRLRRKFVNNLDKSTNGEPPLFPRAHDYKSYYLCKEIWPNDTPKPKPKPKPKANDVVVIKREGPVTKTTLNNDAKGLQQLYPFLMKSLSSDVLGIVINDFNLIAPSELKKLDCEWKNLNILEAEVALNRMDLITKQTKMVLKAINSSPNK